jgi:alanine racemase
MIKAEINLKTIRKNLKTLRSHLNGGVMVCAIVKANAYSLGDTIIAPAIQEHVDWFGVANIRELIRLRQSGIHKPILLLGVCQNYLEAINNDAVITIGSIIELKNLSRATTKPVRIHIKVNTGMNRHGISNLWQLRNMFALVAQNNNIKVDGLYTHFSHETDNTAKIDEQLKRFTPFRNLIRSYYPNAIIHASCSGSAHYRPAQFNMVRIGKSMYGGYDGYQTAITIKARVCAVQQVRSGAGIGYGHAATATNSPTTIAVIPCGYADLAHYNYSNKLNVLIDGIQCPILGRICMDSFMCEATKVVNPIGKWATIISPQKGQTIMEVARATNTIACNMLCCLNFQRSEIIYIK